MVEVRVLGPLEVVCDGEVVALGSARARTVFALLAFRRQHAVEVDSVVETLWPADRPKSATKMVHNTVVALRRVLRDRLAIETEDSAYRLQLEPESLDVSTFEDLAAGGREALARRNWVHADRRLSGALRLWRGAPWSDLHGYASAGAESIRLMELRSVIDDDLIEARIQGGDHAAAVGDIEALVADQPLRERRWAQLVIALAMSGRQAEALRAYQRARSMLADELGLEPGPELRAAEEAVLTGGVARARPEPATGAAAARLGLDPDLGAMANRRILIEECRVAATTARSLGDFRAVATHLVRAVDAARADRMGTDLEATLLAELGHAQVRARQPKAARASFLEAAVLARATGNADALAWAGIGLVGPTFALEANERVVRPILESALELLPKLSGLRARVLAALAQWGCLFNDPAVTRSQRGDAVDMARTLDDTGALAAALLAQLRTSEIPHEAASRLDGANELVALKAVDEADRSLAQYYRASALLDLGQQEWQRAADDFLESAERADDPFLTYRAELTRAARRLMRTGGDPIVYETLMSDRLSEFFADARVADGARREHLLTLRWFEGRLPELIPAIEEQAASAPDHPAWLSASALAYSEAGRLDEARAIVARLGASGFDLPRWPNFWAPMVWHLTTAIAATDDAASAELLTEQLLPVADRACLDKVLYLGSMRHHLGLLARTVGEFALAREHFEIASHTHRRVGASWWVERTQQELNSL